MSPNLDPAYPTTPLDLVLVQWSGRWIVKMNDAYHSALFLVSVSTTRTNHDICINRFLLSSLPLNNTRVAHRLKGS